MAVKIAINGCGRIGRALLRIAAQKPAIEIVAVADIMPIDSAAYALRFDSVHGGLDVKVEGACLVIGARKIPYVLAHTPPNFAALGAEVVIESSGLFLSTESVQHHIDKGVRKVIISAPATDSTPTFVRGVNDNLYAGQPIISNASCTTNCLAPIAMLLDRYFGVEKGTILTVHSYTNDQKLLDSAHRSDFRRSRAAAANMIPTTTGAAKALCRVLPQFKDKLHGHSVRVPVPDVSMLDLNVKLKKSASSESVNAVFKEHASGDLAGILRVDSDYAVSSDFYNDPHSCIVAEDLTFIVADDLLKVMAWYDNEWGYSHRLLEMAQMIMA